MVEVNVVLGTEVFAETEEVCTGEIESFESSESII